MITIGLQPGHRMGMASLRLMPARGRVPARWIGGVVSGATSVQEIRQTVTTLAHRHGSEHLVVADAGSASGATLSWQIDVLEQAGLTVVRTHAADVTEWALPRLRAALLDTLVDRDPLCARAMALALWGAVQKQGLPDPVMAES